MIYKDVEADESTGTRLDRATHVFILGTSSRLRCGTSSRLRCFASAEDEYLDSILNILLLTD